MIDLGKILILSPHQDDEVLGCGGLLAQTPANQVHIRYFNKIHPLVDQAVYDAEHNRLMELLGCGYSYSPFQGVNQLESLPIGDHITDIENFVNSYQPDTLFIPYPDYNQDHRRIFEAAVTATRPHDRNFYVKTIFAYEYPGTTQTNRLTQGFVPTVFLPIDIDKKLALYLVYKSQLRGHRSLDAVQALAQVRGMQCNVLFAEAYMSVRQTLC